VRSIKCNRKVLFVPRQLICTKRLLNMNDRIEKRIELKRPFRGSGAR